MLIYSVSPFMPINLSTKGPLMVADVSVIKFGKLAFYYKCLTKNIIKIPLVGSQIFLVQEIRKQYKIR